MQNVAIEQGLYKRVEEVAQEENASIGDLFSQAIRQYLWDLERKKISKETSIYHKRHEELKNQYLGQYIAMHNGQVVDHDQDFQIVRQRVRKRFGRTSIMITKVEEIAEKPLTRHGFCFEESIQ